MVKPNVEKVKTNGKTTKKKFGGALVGKELMNKLETDKEFRNKALQIYANRLYKRNGKVLDINYSGIRKGLNKDGKEFKYAELTFNGRKSNSRYIAIPCKDKSVSKDTVATFKSIGAGSN